MRMCGECRLCCKVFPLPVLDKPGDEWCKFADGSGCSIHERGQPAVCREYACYWLEHEELPEEYRPDRVGIVVTDRGLLAVGGVELPVLLFNQEHARASCRPPGQTLLSEMVGRGVAVMLLHGDTLRVVYDRARYPAISRKDIVVALRVDQSGDAEELKRLGAVSDDYRPLTWEEAEQLIGDPPRDPAADEGPSGRQNSG